MTIDLADGPLEAWMEAVESRDARFDGWVTIGVTSTGIYCRPSCPTPIRPKRTNMRFFPTPASAQEAGFRACKRCAPDATPGSPEWNRRDDLVARAIRAIDDGVVDREGVGGLAERLAVSSRHLQRLMVSEVGATPIRLARARRARAARILIETTELPFSDVAFASGFESIRQFNDTIREVFAQSPTEMRGKRSTGVRRESAPEWISVNLPFRPPLDVGHLLTWLDGHAVDGIEAIDGSTYRRSMRLPGGPAIGEAIIGDESIQARFRLSSLTDLPQAVQRFRRLLDLDADPLVIEKRLGDDPALAPLIAARPGIRSPGEVDGVDATIRAVLHQQVSVASAKGMCNRLVAEHGDVLEHPYESITHVFPTADTWASINPDDLGLTKARANALHTVAVALADGTVNLDPSADREEARANLLSLKGIGPWTTSIVSLKALSDPDVFCPGDLALRRVAEARGIADDPAGFEAAAEAWRPWRSYAMHHLWAEYMAPVGPGQSAKSAKKSATKPAKKSGTAQSAVATVATKPSKEQS